MEYADEVRDRAALYLHVLNLDSAAEGAQNPSIPALAFGESAIDVSALESYLNANKAELSGSGKPVQIDLSALKSASVPLPKGKNFEDAEETKASAKSPAAATTVGKVTAGESYVEAFRKSPVHENFGEPLFVSPKSVLTDSSGEYEVNVIKYMYSGYIALQFEIRNALPDQIVRDAVVLLQVKGTPLQLVNEVKAGSIAHGETGYAYSVLTYDSNECTFPAGTLKCKMQFSVVEIDSGTKAEQGSYADEYALPDLVISAKDYVRGKAMESKQFLYLIYILQKGRSAWNEMAKRKDCVEKSQNYQIAYKSLAEATAALSRFFGMTAVPGTDKVELGASVHQMQLAGEVQDKSQVLAVVKIKMDAKYGCVLSLQVRTLHSDLCDLIMNSLS